MWSSTRPSQRAPPISPLCSTRSRPRSLMSWWRALPPADAIAITRQMRELDVNVKMYGATPGGAFPDYYKTLGNTAESVYSGSSWEPGLPYPATGSSWRPISRSSHATPPRALQRPTPAASSSWTPSGGCYSLDSDKPG